jgi:hypothetical protein
LVTLVSCVTLRHFVFTWIHHDEGVDGRIMSY